MKIDYKNILIGIGTSAILLVSLWVGMISLADSGLIPSGTDTTFVSSDVSSDVSLKGPGKDGGFCLEKTGPIKGTENASKITFDSKGNMWFLDGNTPIKDLAVIDVNGNKTTYKLGLKLSDLLIVGDKYYVADVSSTSASFIKKYRIDNNVLVLEWNKKITTASGGNAMLLSYSSTYDFVYALTPSTSKYLIYWVTQDGVNYGGYTKQKNLYDVRSFSAFGNKLYTVGLAQVDVFESDQSGKKSVNESSFGSFNDGRDIVFFAGKIYVGTSNGFYVFDSNGNLLTVLTNINSIDMAVSPDGSIYYTDPHGGIYKITLKGACATLTIIKKVIVGTEEDESATENNDYDYWEDFLFDIFTTKLNTSVLLKRFTLDDDAGKDKTYSDTETMFLLPSHYSILEQLTLEQEKKFTTHYKCESDKVEQNNQAGQGTSAGVNLIESEKVTCTFYNTKSE